MRIALINIVISVIVLLIISGVFYYNRQPSDNIDDMTMHALLRNTEANAYNQWKTFTPDKKFQNDSLSSFVEYLEKPILMLRIKETSCQTCVSSELDNMKEFKNNGIKCVLLATYKQSVIDKLLRAKGCKDITVFHVPNDCLYDNWYIEKFESPYYFVLHHNKKVSDFFLPEKTKPELTDYYIKSVASLFYTGSTFANKKY
jgi:hypothetical protein